MSCAAGHHNSDGVDAGGHLANNILHGGLPWQWQRQCQQAPSQQGPVQQWSQHQCSYVRHVDVLSVLWIFFQHTFTLAAITECCLNSFQRMQDIHPIMAPAYAWCRCFLTMSQILCESAFARWWGVFIYMKICWYCCSKGNFDKHLGTAIHWTVLVYSMCTLFGGIGITGPRLGDCGIGGIGWCSPTMMWNLVMDDASAGPIYALRDTSSMVDGVRVHYIPDWVIFPMDDIP